MPNTPALRRPRRWKRAAAVWAVLVLVAGALQLPLAWGWVWLYPCTYHHERTTRLSRPEGVVSGVEQIEVSNNSYPGVRWVEITGWPPETDYAARPDYTKADEEPYLTAPAHPWNNQEAHPVLADMARWPADLGALHRPGTPIGMMLVQLEALGWPFACVGGKLVYEPATGTFRAEGLIFGPEITPLRSARMGPVSVPYHPMWRGYALNSLVHGTAFFAVTFGVARLVSRVRRKAGHCARCRYDLRGLSARSPCPECGVGGAIESAEGMGRFQRTCAS